MASLSFSSYVFSFGGSTGAVVAAGAAFKASQAA
jgi:hypothetical protein